jgi:hypothetical protein
LRPMCTSHHGSPSCHPAIADPTTASKITTRSRRRRLFERAWRYAARYDELAFRCSEFNTTTHRPDAYLGGAMRSIRLWKRSAVVSGALARARSTAGTITAIHRSPSAIRKLAVRTLPQAQADRYRERYPGQGPYSSISDERAKGYGRLASEQNIRSQTSGYARRQLNAESGKNSY